MHPVLVLTNFLLANYFQKFIGNKLYCCQNRFTSPKSNKKLTERKLYESFQASITGHHRLSGLKNRNLFSHSSRSWKFKISQLARLVSSETSFPGFQMSLSLLTLDLVD